MKKKLLQKNCLSKVFAYTDSSEGCISPPQALTPWPPEASSKCCDVCIQNCPGQAISLEPEIKIEADKCLDCGLCSHICPVGIFRENDQTDPLLALVQQIKGVNILELTCMDLKGTDTGPLGSDMVLHTGGCLAAVGPSIYINLFASGVKEIRVRLDKCDTCQKRKVKKEIEKILSRVKEMFSLEEGSDYRVHIIKSKKTGWEIRQATNSPKNKITRRDFLQGFIPSTDPGAEVNHPPQERIRMINALQRLKEVPGNMLNSALKNLSFTGLQVSSTCTACGACERVCSCGALKIVHENDGVFKLVFYPGNCISCGLCGKVCHYRAIDFYTFSISPDFEELKPVVLISGELRTCQRCGAGFLSKSDSKRCPPCEFRLKNPFGSIHLATT